MIPDFLICNGCKGKANGDGFSVAIPEDEDMKDVPGLLILEIKAGMDPKYKIHVCGKECLIKTLNGIIDKISPGTTVAAAAPGSTPQ